MLFLSALLTPSLEHNTVNVVNRILQALNINVSRPTVKQTITEHPDFPSLLTISDALHGWRVQNVSVKTNLDKLKTLPPPFLVQLKEDNSAYFTVVKSITEEVLMVSDRQSRRWNSLSWADFTSQWMGVITLLEAEQEAGEKDYKKHEREHLRRQIVPVAAGIFIVALWLSQSVLLAGTGGWTSWPVITLLALKAFGCYIGSLLLWYEVDKQNAALDKVCKAGKKVNCHAVLQSSASKIMGISWSEVGFVYFAGSFLSLLLGSTGAGCLALLAWLNVMALPYTLFSVYYQWRVAKQWCLLCLTVQVLLVLEFIVNIAGGQLRGFSLTAGQWLQSLFFFGALALGWSLLKPSLSLAKESKKNSNELTRLKRNTQIFESLLMRQKAITADPTGLGITLGNPAAKYKLIKVCNPYCGPCAKAHPDIEELLHHNPDLQVQIIFTATNDESDKKAAPVKHLLALAEKQQEALTQRALDDWYNAPQVDYVAFARKYPLNGELSKQGHKLEAMSAWCKETGIEFTPTFFIQGRQLPELYKVKDLKHFLPG